MGAANINGQLSNSASTIAPIALTIVASAVLTVMFNIYLYEGTLNLLLRLYGFFSGASSIETDLVVWLSNTEELRNSFWGGYFFPFCLIYSLIEGTVRRGWEDAVEGR